MTKWRVWCPDRGQTADHCWTADLFYIDKDATWAAEAWASKYAYGIKPFDRIECFVERLNEENVWSERTKCVVTVRVEPVFEARIL